MDEEFSSVPEEPQEDDIARQIEDACRLQFESDRLLAEEWATAESELLDDGP